MKKLLIKTSVWWLPPVLCLLSICVIPRSSWALLLWGEPAAVAQLFVSPEAPTEIRPMPLRLNIPLGVSDGFFTTLHINQWSQSTSALDFYLIDETTQEKKILSHRPINRHRDFDLTRFLQPGHSYSLQLDLKPDQGNAYMDELTVRKFPGVAYFPPLHLCFAIAFIAAVLLSRVRNSRRVLSVRTWEIVGLLALLAFAARWQALAAMHGQPLEGDAGSYSLLAHNLSWLSPFQNGHREPFYIWAQNAAMLIFGAEVWKFRAVTLLISVASVVVLYFLSVALSGKRWVAVIACVLVALGDYAVSDAIRGERSQLFAFLVLLFALGAVKMIPSSWRREAVLGGLAGLLSWTWLVGAIGAALAYGIRWIRYKIPFRWALGFCFVFALMIAGFLFQQWKYGGDPLLSLNAHVKFYQNAKETGVPSYDGKKTNWFLYLLGDQGITKVLKDNFTSLVDLFFNPTNSFNKIFLGFHYSQPYSYALFPFLIFGFISTLYDKEYWSWLLLLSFLNVSASVLGDVRDPRLFYHVLPFFAYFFAYGLEKAGRLLGLGIKSIH